MKTQTFNLRLTTEEKRMLSIVAEHTGLAAADVIRLGVRERFHALPPKIRKQLEVE